MTVKRARSLAGVTFLAVTLSSCAPKPPFNDFHREPPNVKRTITGAGLGSVAGYLIGGAISSTLIGGAIGATAGSLVGIYRESKHNIINELRKQNIQYVEYGDTMTLIVPTDQYYIFDTPRLNDICYPGLINIIKLLNFSHCGRVYVAGFTDNVGARRHKRLLSQARAETMIGFLYANGIPAKLLKAEGYGDKYPIGDNHWIRGSAYNRRVEIQWFNVPEVQAVSSMK